MVQNHLSNVEMTNLGSFYTPERFVEKTIEILKKSIPNYQEYTFLDTSCGYGVFFGLLDDVKEIGCDIDSKALDIAKEQNKNARFFNANTLCGFSRRTLNLNHDSKIIIVGNPPYNDTTSKVKNRIKVSTPCEIDEDLKTRDLGISFLLSFNKLNAD